MNNNNPYEKYADNNILTAPKEELTLMLYDGALKFTNQAIVAMQDKEYDKSNNLNIRTQNIFRELQFTLNFNYEISNQLNSLYDYVITTLIQANIKKEITLLEEIRDMIREFRDLWKEAMKKSKTELSTAKI